MDRKAILEAAEKCVCGHREQDYGSPERNFNCIADYWGIYLSNRFDDEGIENIVLSGSDVAAMMCLFKLARITTSPDGGTNDTWVDVAGYAACGGEILSQYRMDFEAAFELKTANANHG